MSARARTRRGLGRAAWTIAALVFAMNALTAVAMSIALDWSARVFLGRRAQILAHAFGDRIAEPLCDLVDVCLDRRAALNARDLWGLRPFDERRGIRAASPPPGPTDSTHDRTG